MFQNSYTRDGVAHRVRRWSVKLQFQRRRRTFSLPAPSRQVAAKQACSLHEVLCNAGWDAAILAHRALSPPENAHSIAEQRGEWSSETLEYWKARLVCRKYPDPNGSVPDELSVRIEHGASYRFFPLASADSDVAAQRALEIHRELRVHGWKLVLARHRSEFTLAVFWHHNPVVCTYTTLYTLFDSQTLRSVRPPAKTGLSIGLIEPDPSVIPVLHHWIHRQAGVSSVVRFATAAESLLALGNRAIDMLLINRALPDLPATTLLKRLRTIHPKLVSFLYGICEDSDQVFSSISGAPSGYFLQRRQADNLFAPIQAAIGSEAFSPSQISSRIRDYFQSCFDAAPHAKDQTWLNQLTDREQEILNCLSKGYPDKEISHILNISVWTVHNHIKHIYEKLNVHTRTEAVLKALYK